MQIGISGASGQLGTATVAELKLRAPDAHIIGISRAPDKVQELGIDARVGEFDQPDSLSTAFADLDRLLIIPSGDMRPGFAPHRDATQLNGPSQRPSSMSCSRHRSAHGRRTRHTSGRAISFPNKH
jgi:uncharacterized protein YbjT (DUF2867 family)